MLKFFRKIRQKLLGEGNLKKYLIYAVGEILLVVIGILIALQINIWSTQSQENKELKGYIDNIARNVTSDLEELRSLKSFRDSTRVFSSNLITLSRAKTVSQEAFQKTWRWEYNAFITKYFNSDQSGFDALKSAGYLSKLQGKELELKLYDYYNMVSEVLTEQQKLNAFLEHMSIKSNETNVMQSLDNLRFHTDSYSQDFSEESSTILSLLQHPTITGANMRNRDQRAVTNLYNKIIPLGEEVLRICKAELTL